MRYAVRTEQEDGWFQTSGKLVEDVLHLTLSMRIVLLTSNFNAAPKHLFCFGSPLEFQVLISQLLVGRNVRRVTLKDLKQKRYGDLNLPLSGILQSKCITRERIVWIVLEKVLELCDTVAFHN